MSEYSCCSARGARSIERWPSLLARLTFVLLLLASANARGADFVVNSIIDAVDTTPGDAICASAAGECTLRAAVMEANSLAGWDSISVPAGQFVLTLGGPGESASGGDLNLGGELHLRGAGASETVIDGGGIDRVFSSIGDVEISDLTIAGGETIQPGAALYGWTDEGDLRLTDVIVMSNRSSSGRGAVSGNDIKLTRVTIRANFGGGIWGGSYSYGWRLENVAVIENEGVGIQVHSDNDIFINNSIIRQNSGAGVVVSDAGLTLRDSVISDNQGGGVVVGADTFTLIERSTISGNLDTGLEIQHNGGDPSFVTVRDTLFTSNQSDDGPGGIAMLGGVAMDLELQNVTISQNSGVSGGGIGLLDSWTSHPSYSGALCQARLIIENSTIVGNSASQIGGGIGVILEPGIFCADDYWNSPHSNFSITSSVIAKNFANSQASDCSHLPDVYLEPILTSGGNNLVGDGTGCGLATQATDRVGTTAAPIDPLLGALADNGGPTLTHALLVGSPALETGGATCLYLDQRGVARPFDADANGSPECDIGAYEAGDFDGDGIGDLADNCIVISNADQINTDRDAEGDACDADDDNDGVSDSADSFPLDDDNEQAQCEVDLTGATASLNVCSAELDQCLVQLATPEVLLETATLGPVGGTSNHFPVTSTVFVGSRFQVLAPTTTGSVGAHIVETLPAFGGAPGELFAAIVALTGPSDYPDSFDLSTPDVLGSALLPLPIASAEISADLALPLTPGWYALLLGSGRLGASGGGAVTLNNPVIGTPSMFGGFVSTTSWTPVSLAARLFVRTESTDLLSCENDLTQCQMTLIDGNGDVNGDGASDLLDSVLFRRWLAGFPIQ